MKTLILFFAALLTSNVFGQSNLKWTMASNVLYFNSGGLTGQSNEILSSRSDSSSSSAASSKYLVCFEGVFYQTFHSGKFETGIGKCVFRKSNDGINWTNVVRVGDAPAGKGEIDPVISVWRKDTNINVGIAYIDRRGSAEQCRFTLSTDGGTTFQPTVQISNNTTRIISYTGGMTGKGDTLAVCWVSNTGIPSHSPTYTSVTTNGGLNWSVPKISYAGDNWSYITDIDIDKTTNIIYTVAFTDSVPYGRRNPHIYRSTNLGSTWSFVKRITNDPVPNLHIWGEIISYRDTLYSIWNHGVNNNGLVDRIWFTKSTDGGFNWDSLRRVNDADTLMGAGTNLWAYSDFHPALAFTESGTIYGVWADARTKSSSNYDSCHFNTYISRSTNRGVNWSASYLVNAPSNTTNVKNSLPCIAVKSSGGVDTVLVTWSKKRDVNILPVTTLDLTVLIEGFYRPETNTTVQDTLTVYLHNNYSPYNIVDSSIAFLSSDGDAIFTFTNAEEDIYYYLRIKHRNALETWSKFPGQRFLPTHGPDLTYDFTTDASQAFENNMNLVSESPLKFAIYSGDINQDGFIALEDITLVFNDASAFVTGYVNTDVTGDNITDLSDLLITYNNSSDFVERKTP